MAKNLKLKSARALLDMTQLDLANAVGVTRQTISGIEKGEYNPSIKLCIAICKVLGKTLNELFWEDWFSMKLDNKECQMYDERQIRERGMIFKLSFFILVFYNVITAFLSEYTPFWSKNFSLFQSNFIGIIFATTIGSILMITNNAYISPIKPTISHISIGIMTISSIVALIGNVKYLDWFNIIISICILMICCTYFIKLSIDKKNINIDDEI